MGKGNSKTKEGRQLTPDEIRKHTRIHWQYLMDHLDAELYINHLYSSEYLSRAARQKLRAITVPADKVEVLLDILEVLDPDVQVFLFHQITKDQPFIINHIERQHMQREVTGEPQIAPPVQENAGVASDVLQQTATQDGAVSNDKAQVDTVVALDTLQEQTTQDGAVCNDKAQVDTVVALDTLQEQRNREIEAVLQRNTDAIETTLQRNKDEVETTLQTIMQQLEARKDCPRETSQHIEQTEALQKEAKQSADKIEALQKEAKQSADKIEKTKKKIKALQKEAQTNADMVKAWQMERSEITAQIEKDTKENNEQIEKVEMSSQTDAEKIGLMDEIGEEIGKKIIKIHSEMKENRSADFAEKMYKEKAIDVCLIVLASRRVQVEDHVVCLAWQVMTLICKSKLACCKTISLGAVLAARYFLMNYQMHMEIMKTTLDYLITVCNYPDLQTCIGSLGGLMKLLGTLVDSDHAPISYRACRVYVVFEGPRDTYMHAKIKTAVKRWSKRRSLDLEYQPRGFHRHIYIDWLTQHQHGKHAFAVWTLNYFMRTDAARYSAKMKASFEPTVSRLLRENTGIVSADKKKLRKLYDKWNTK